MVGALEVRSRYTSMFAILAMYLLPYQGSGKETITYFKPVSGLALVIKHF